MRRLCLLFGLIAVALGALPAQAVELRFPKTGKYAFHIDLPKTWRTKTDTRGGLLLIPPAANQHALIYLGILVDDKMRGQPDSAIAESLGKTVGITAFDKDEPARVSDKAGATRHGTAFYGKIPEKRGLSRKGKIVIVPLEPNTWAQVWTVTQPGMNPVEHKTLEQVLNSLTLDGEK
ncbi:MAG TPA: hypothetical protein VGF53_07200 [Pseudolabrys sp.]